jgi:hypothetical protein
MSKGILFEVGNRSLGRELSIKANFINKEAYYMSDRKIKDSDVVLFTHCVGCGKEYKVKKGEKIDRMMFCTDECANNTPVEGDSPILYNQDGIILNQ